jgi:hypothetical protein
MSIQTQAVSIAKKMHEFSGTTVTLTDPDGDQQTYTDCIFLSGRVTESPDSGEEAVIFRPVATFPRSSLSRIPLNGEHWTLEAPLDPELPDVKTVMTMDSCKSIEGGRSLGVIRLYLSETRQST